MPSRTTNKQDSATGKGGRTVRHVCTIKRDARFAAAVDVIVRYCGEQAREVLLGGRHKLSAKTIEQLSRKALPMQQAHVAHLKRHGSLRTWPSYSKLVKKAYPGIVRDDSQTPPH